MAKGKKTGGRRPGSKNKVPPEIKALAQGMVPQAITQLGRLLRAKNTGESARLRAIEIIFERAHGRPAQAVQHSGAIGSYDLSNASDADIDDLEIILARIAKSGTGEGGEGPA